MRWLATFWNLLPRRIAGGSVGTGVNRRLDAERALNTPDPDHAEEIRRRQAALIVRYVVHLRATSAPVSQGAVADMRNTQSHLMN